MCGPIICLSRTVRCLIINGAVTTGLGTIWIPHLHERFAGRKPGPSFVRRGVRITIASRETLKFIVGYIVCKKHGSKASDCKRYR